MERSLTTSAETSHSALLKTIYSNKQESKKMKVLTQKKLTEGNKPFFFLFSAAQIE